MKKTLLLLFLIPNLVMGECMNEFDEVFSLTLSGTSIKQYEECKKKYQDSVELLKKQSDSDYQNEFERRRQAIQEYEKSDDFKNLMKRKLAIEKECAEETKDVRTEFASRTIYQNCLERNNLAL